METNYRMKAHASCRELYEFLQWLLAGTQVFENIFKRYILDSASEVGTFRAFPFANIYPVSKNGKHQLS